LFCSAKKTFFTSASQTFSSFTEKLIYSKKPVAEQLSINCGKNAHRTDFGYWVSKRIQSFDVEIHFPRNRSVRWCCHLLRLKQSLGGHHKINATKHKEYLLLAYPEWLLVFLITFLLGKFGTNYQSGMRWNKKLSWQLEYDIFGFSATKSREIHFTIFDRALLLAIFFGRIHPFKCSCFLLILANFIFHPFFSLTQNTFRWNKLRWFKILRKNPKTLVLCMCMFWA
jgi:hypothetical protein